MAQGLGGWIGGDILFTQARKCDLVFWTWKLKPLRIDGHVGVFLDRKDELGVTHASGRGVVLDRIRGVLRDDISRVRHLTIGE